jgi:hypothetical protein
MHESGDLGAPGPTVSSVSGKGPSGPQDSRRAGNEVVREYFWECRVDCRPSPVPEAQAAPCGQVARRAQSRGGRWRSGGPAWAAMAAASRCLPGRWVLGCRRSTLRRGGTQSHGGRRRTGLRVGLPVPPEGRRPLGWRSGG